MHYTTRFGTNNFQEALKIPNGSPESDIDWQSFKYKVFDSPTHRGTYSERYAFIGIPTISDHFRYSIHTLNMEMILQTEQQLKAHGAPEFVEVANKDVVKDTQHIATFFQQIVDTGGEGIILRDPKSPYQPGRSYGFLKHKVFPHILPLCLF